MEQLFALYKRMGPPLGIGVNKMNAAAAVAMSIVCTPSGPMSPPASWSPRGSTELPEADPVAPGSEDARFKLDSNSRTARCGVAEEASP